MASTLTVLGAGSILPRVGYGCSGYALRTDAESTGDAAEGTTLLDCGPGTVRALAPAGIELASVERVVLSHFHPDHCLDLFALAFARRNPAAVDLPRLEVIGPRGLAQWWEAAGNALGRWVRDPDALVRECGTDFEVNEPFQAGPWTLRCAPTGHTPTALAWRAEGAHGAGLTYSGDSGECAALADLAAESTLFLCECSFPEELASAEHLTPRGAGRLAASANCGELLLTHFYPSLDPAVAVREAREVWSGPVTAARDGSIHSIDPGR